MLSDFDPVHEDEKKQDYYMAWIEHANTRKECNKYLISKSYNSEFEN